MNEELVNPCRLCPRKCGARRLEGETGFCGARDAVTAARAALHFWEEPCISGTRGSGAVFFSNCNLRCVFCQNDRISREGFGLEVSTEKLAQIFLSLASQGAHNINLVTAVHYLPWVAEALKKARESGLIIPAVYNSGGYESAEILKAFRGTFDIYMPDLKYVSRELAASLSAAGDYPREAVAAIDEMLDQTGPAVIDGEGIMKSGVLIRHLVLPGHTREAVSVLRLIRERWGNDVHVSLLNQYTPMPGIEQRCTDPNLSRRLTAREYDKVVNEAIRLGLENVFIQEGSASGADFIPEFDGEGI